MPTISAGATSSITLVAGQTVTFSPGAGEALTYEVTRSSILIGGGRITSGRTLGPYEAGDVMTITADRGAADYSLDIYTDPADSASHGKVRILKATTGTYTVTGGTAGTKTTLLTVALPDDDWSIANLNVRLVIEYGVYYTNSDNTKTYGIDIGTTAGTAVALRTQAPTDTGTASETTRMVVQRDAANSTRLRIEIPNNYRVFGNAAGSGATVGTLASASINPDTTGMSLFFHGAVDPNTEAITFEHVYVALEKAEQ